MSDEIVKPSRKKWYALALIIIIVPIGAFGAWWIISQPPPVTGITLKIITRHDTTIWFEYRNAFLATDIAKDANIIWIDFISPVAAAWPDAIVSPVGQPDVAWGGGPTLFDTLHEQGLLQKMNSTRMLDVASRVPETIAGAVMKRYDNDDDIIWMAAAISSFGFTVNNQTLNDLSLPLPTHWENLSSPEYGTHLPTASIAMGNSPGTTSNTRIYEIIIQKFGWVKGWEILTRMGGNANIYPGSVETQTGAESGETAVSMSIDFYGYTSMMQYPFCQYIIPQNETIVNGDPIAIPVTCQHQEEAELFIDWVLSCEGQSHWLVPDINRMPVLECAFSTALGQTRPDLYEFYNKTLDNIGIPFNDTLVLTYEESLMYYFESIITDSHSELVSCWRKLVNYYLVDPVGRKAQFEAWAVQMTAPVTITDPYTSASESFTQSYAQEVNHLIRFDSAFRSLIKSEWTAAAQAQYAAVEALIP